MSFRAPEPDHLLPVFADDNMCNATPQRCRYSCGNQCAHDIPNTSDNPVFEEVVRRFISRRRLLGGGVAAAGMLVASTTPLLRSREALAAEDAPAQAGGDLTFAPISLSNEDKVQAPAGYTANVLIRWGDPLFIDSASFAFGKNTAADQEGQFGYNCDYVGFYPLRENLALLVVNHEYTNPEIMFPGYSASSPTKEQVDLELAAHGASVVTLQKSMDKGWQYVPGGFANRRTTGTTKTMLTGPAAGHAWMKTTGDPTGYFPLGTLNNCSAGQTPWGTVLTCEENFNQYFANQGQVADAAKKEAHRRYGLPAAASERKWERFYDRFDLAKEPNEAFRYGWVVEIDPHDRSSMPRKHTALGRFKHEATTTTVAPDGRVVVYMGDDERFDYVYKFVSRGKFNPAGVPSYDGKWDAEARAANMQLLEDGTLYVAKYNTDGSGTWIPLVYGSGALTQARGFTSQADVMIRARAAGDAVGATKMDRPEDIEINPVNNRVYAAMTNNTNRGTGTNAAPDAANPRASNRHGHIIEMTPAGGDHAATSFGWSIFMLCGDPKSESGTYFAGHDVSKVSPISSPDNITFDSKGNLWISTDGQTGTFRKNDGVYVVPTAGPERGYCRQFASGVPGGETASLTFDSADSALFVSIQHPGEGSTLDELTSHFPDGEEPRPSVVVVTKNDGGTIGS